MTTNAEIDAQGGEFSRGWMLLLASFVGVAVGLTGMPFYSYGVFAGALEAEFGWTRAQTQAPLAFQSLGALIMLPFVGYACDRFGARPVALISMILYGFTFAALCLLGPSVWQYYANVFVLGLVGAGTSPITWTRAVSGAFDKNRGIALGMTLMGTGVIGFTAPLIATFMIENYGWRAAWLTLSGFPLLIGVPVVMFMFREKIGHAVSSAAALAGLTVMQAVKNYRFALIAIAFMVISFGIGGSIQNLFPLYVGAGFTPQEAAGMYALIGLSVIFGRVATGFLLDRFWAPGVAAVLMCLPAISCFLLFSGEISANDARIATVLLGLAAGAEFDIIAYLASRYFGMRAYAQIYGYLFMAFSIGAAMAPAIFGYVFDQTGSYSAILVVSAGLFIIGGLSLLLLGKYPKFETPAAS